VDGCYNRAVSSFYVENFGCRATQADGAAIERQLLDLGLHRAPAPQQASVVVLNTCTVTASADHDVRATVRRIHRHNPDCRILVTGCYAQRAPQELATLPGVRWVVGNSHKSRVGEIVEIGIQAPSSANFVPLGSLSQRDDDAETEIHVGDIFAHTELLAAPVFGAGQDRTRPNLKVQDGCDNRCSFCIIPAVRGQSRSLPLDEVLREVDGLVAAGYREVVVSGINLGRWGCDFTPPDRFEGLVRAIVEQTGLERLRISSVEPMDWTDELIELVAGCRRIAKHAHVPLQSASDRILRRMHRRYRPWHYAEKIRKIRAAMPTAAIGADVMVGFPGETGADFEETRRLIEDLPFTYLHVFTYSSRPGTRSAAMSNQVPAQVARARNRILRQLAVEKKRAFQQSFLGQELEAITLNVHDGECTEALSDNYLKLRLAGKHAANRWIGARISHLHEDALWGRVLPEAAG
jgi:threonylcarbamoyladenosine tRNA methylthiotransferase MtaB